MADGTNFDSKYQQYQADVAADIASTIQKMGVQPILFVGSGLSKRYFSGPSWDELLAQMADTCPLIDKDYAYYKQAFGSPLLIGEEFAKRYHEWAWSTGKSKFPKSMFTNDISAQSYLKFKISEYLRSITPASLSSFKGTTAKELSALCNIRPHALITTNYDQFLDRAFSDYAPIIGQQIVLGSPVSIGEIFKIHGCVSEPDSLVLTQSDFEIFTRRKKYLSAKLLTYFSEHPLLFVGYSASDPNIRSILSDIDEALPIAGDIIPNVFILEWRSGITKKDKFARERLIAIEDSKSVRIKAIEAEDFTWVFEAFGAQHTLNGVNPKVLRALLARSYDLVRHDIPQKTVQADFQMLEHAVDNAESFAKLFGITTVSNPSIISAQYPFSLSDLGRKLGGKGWHPAQKLFEEIRAQKGFDIKGSDNKYHCAVKVGAGSVFHKYSEAAVNLLTAVKAGQPYEV